MTFRTLRVEGLPDRFQQSSASLVRHVYSVRGRSYRSSDFNDYWGMTQVSYDTQRSGCCYVQVAEGWADTPGRSMVYSIDSRNLNIKDKTANDKYFSLGTTEFEEVLKDLTHRIFEREPARQRRAEEAATRRAAREAEARLQREEERRLEAVREAARQAAREAVLTKIREEKVALLVAQCPSIGEKGSAAEASGDKLDSNNKRQRMMGQTAAPGQRFLHQDRDDTDGENPDPTACKECGEECIFCSAPKCIALQCDDCRTPTPASERFVEIVMQSFVKIVRQSTNRGAIKSQSRPKKKIMERLY
ncbi:hypothetical protein WJX84_000091 [Apatococcus fuscideae]|uniref:Uncharacterized protein n=1 Tax=Apatococcus fuscideae TaxID=2026836 RepID=A0AAW1TDB9_9CHLO